MKLRTKLVLLVSAAVALFLVSVGGYFFVLSPVETMQGEEKILMEIDRAVSNLQVAANQLLVSPMADQTDVFEKAVARYNDAYSATKKIVVLRTVTGDVADSIKAVENLGQLASGNISGLEGALKDLAEGVKSNPTALKISSWTQLYRTATADEKNGGMVLFYLQNIANLLDALNQTLNVSREVIETKDALIVDHLSTIKATSSLVGLAGILVAMVLALIFSFLLARNISRSLSQIGSTVAKVSSGDLRLRFASSRKDELGVLGRDIDLLLDSLTAAFRRIQEASAENLEVKDQLVRSVSEATSSAVEIEANSSSILAQLQKADDRIQASQAELNGVVILLEAFHARLGAQGREVGEATQAVANLAQGIARISSLSDENRQAVEALLAESDRGREVFDRSFSKVAEINDSVSAIQDLVGAIADIAGQTNILALNAAIEAAHAGEAGKGFAVVADEISKLAAASAASSAQIATTIQEVVGKIREAGATREETLGAFGAIGNHIGRVSDQGKGIYTEAVNMDQGTHRIRQVMESLSSSATDTTAEADRISTVATNLGDALGHVGRISHEVVSNIGEITQGLAEISRTVTEVSGQAERLGRVGEGLDRAVNAFQTGDADEEPKP